MKVHIAFNSSHLEHAISVAHTVAPYADAIEIGVSLLYKYGISVVPQFREACPKTPLLIDTKIADKARIIVPIFASVKPQWITVLAGAHNKVIHATCVAAHDARLQVMMDLLDTRSIGQSAMEAQNLGVDALLFHQSHEGEESLDFLEQWDMVRGNTNLPIYVSAKITRQNIHGIIEVSPHGIIIGTSIVDADDPAKEAKFFYNTCHGKE